MRLRLTIFACIFILLAGALALFLWPAAPEPASEVVAVATEGVAVKIGESVEGRTIETYAFGGGNTELLFVGGIHGGYEWNSILLAYEFIDYFNENPAAIPADTTITIIPALNPDGLFAVTGKEGRFNPSDVYVDTSDGTGRFNAHDVDLNRNFDCKWEPESSWRSMPVDAGTKAFSEPEAVALRNLIQQSNFSAAVFWHSQSNAVYASECEEGVLPVTTDVMNLYADAAGYRAVETFDAYPITGDVEGWLASIGIPAITVELKTHETVEWAENLAGVQALLGYFATHNVAR